MSAKRRCANCGGPVYSVRFTSKTEHPARDAQGRFIFEGATDPVTGQPFERQVMVDTATQGLGTWKCARGCKSYRIVQTQRNIGAGKEHDRGSSVRGHNSWHGLDLADDAIRSVESRRPIAVITTYNSEGK